MSLLRCRLRLIFVAYHVTTRTRVYTPYRKVLDDTTETNTSSSLDNERETEVEETKNKMEDIEELKKYIDFKVDQEESYEETKSSSPRLVSPRRCTYKSLYILLEKFDFLDVLSFINIYDFSYTFKFCSGFTDSFY